MADPLPVDPASGEKRDAIVFLPGVGRWAGQSIDNIARRIAATCNTRAATRAANFRTSASGPYNAEGVDMDVKVCTIERIDGQKTTEVIDLFFLDYRGTVEARYDNLVPAIRAFYLLVAIVDSFRRMVRWSFQPGLETREKAQVGYCTLALCILIVYFGLVLIALVQTTGQVLASPAPAPVGNAPAAPSGVGGARKSEPPAQARPAGWLQRFGARLGHVPAAVASVLAASSNGPTRSQGLVILVSALALLCTPRARARLTQLGNSYLFFYYYLAYGIIRGGIQRNLQILLDRIRSTNQPRLAAPLYENIHIFAYSFGSIAVLDTLFPYDTPPPAALESIGTLVTIGCPFDMVRTYFREALPRREQQDAGVGYFENRYAATNSPQDWLNVFLLADVLSSNFRDDAADDVAQSGIGLKSGVTSRWKTPALPRNLSWKTANSFSAATMSLWEIMAFKGVTSHSAYWGDEGVEDADCFDAIIPAMYGNHFILS